jgi:phosphoglycolate phosphatase
MFATTKSSDDGPSKPNPAILFAAMREANVGSDSCVMVGDSVFDMKMARAAGVGAVGVAWGYSSPDPLFAAGASSVATSFSELLVNLGYAEGR